MHGLYPLISCYFLGQHQVVLHPQHSNAISPIKVTNILSTKSQYSVTLTELIALLLKCSVELTVNSLVKPASENPLK